MNNIGKIVLAFCLLINCCLFGQKGPLEDLSPYLRLNKKVDIDNVEGSQYFDNKDFKKIVNFNIKLRYNAYQDVFEIVNNDEVYNISKSKDFPIKFEHDNIEYRFLYYPTKFGNVEGYLRLICENSNNKISLFVRDKIILIPGEKSTNGILPDKEPVLVKEKPLFVVFLKNKSFSFYDKKEFLKNFTDNSVIEFIRKEKISFSNEDDMYKICDFLDKNS